MVANAYIARALETMDSLDKEGSSSRLLLMSHAGFGKTTTVEKWCEYKDYNLVTLIASQYAPDDILGIQSLIDNKLVRLTPSWFNYLTEVAKNGKRTVLFLDEISTCDSFTQGPLLDLIFHKSLGEKKLPENTMIVAAGNYSSDLNNAFKMSSPLVNRFVILNLTSKDYNMGELFTDDFQNLKSKEAVEKFFHLKKEDPIYSYDKFKSWVGTSGDELQFGDVEYVEDPNYGLLGFTSIRSVSYCQEFMRMYMPSYSDNLWMRIVGDTLGTSKKREGKPMRDVLYAFRNEFMMNEGTKKSDYTFKSAMQKQIDSGILLPDALEFMDKFLDTATSKTMSTREATMFETFINAFPGERVRLERLIDKFLKRMKEA